MREYMPYGAHTFEGEDFDGGGAESVAFLRRDDDIRVAHDA